MQENFLQKHQNVGMGVINTAL